MPDTLLQTAPATAFPGIPASCAPIITPIIPDPTAPLRAEVARLRRRLASHTWAEIAGLTVGQERILRVLIMDAPNVVIRDQIAVRAMGRQHYESNSIDVQIWRMRKLLAPLGVGIECHYGYGFSISSEVVAILVREEAA